MASAGQDDVPTGSTNKPAVLVIGGLGMLPLYHRSSTISISSGAPRDKMSLSPDCDQIALSAYITRDLSRALTNGASRQAMSAASSSITSMANHSRVHSVSLTNSFRSLRYSPLNTKSPVANLTSSKPMPLGHNRFRASLTFPTAGNSTTYSIVAARHDIAKKMRFTNYDHTICP